MKDTVEVSWFSEQAYGHITDQDLEGYSSGRLGFPNTYFDPKKAHVLYNQYHDQYAFADEVGFDGVQTNEHHTSYWCMKPSVNIDAAMAIKLTKKAKVILLGNLIAVNDPVRMSEEIAMLDCVSGGRLVSGFIRGTAPESITGGIDPTENRARFEEAHDLIIRCWTQPGPFRYEGDFFHHRVVNPWVLPYQQPHPPVWIPGTSSVESVEWAARHHYPYMNLGSLHETTMEMKKVYRETAAEVGYTPGPEHFGYVVRALVADTDEKAQEIGRHYMWTHDHRMKGPREENDPPGYQSREAAALRARRRGLGSTEKMSYEELLAIDNIIAGSPETVTNKLGKLVEGLNPGFLFIYGNEGPMEHSDTMRSIELLGKEVIPALREIKLRPEE